MSQPLLDLDGLKLLFKKGMDHAIKKYSNPFTSKLKDLCDLQLSIVEKAQDVNSFMNMAWITNPVLQNAFAKPKPVCTGCELQLTPVQFGVGNIGWYFISGIAGQYAYNISIFRAEVAPPEVVNFDRNEAVRWIVMGGYGLVGGDWYEISPEWMYLKYTQPTYSTFSLSGSNSKMNFSFVSAIPMQFQLNISYVDTTNTNRSFSSQLVANTPPNANMPNSYSNYLGYNSMYYSYPDLLMNISVDNTPAVSGKAWIDHQLLGVNLPSFYNKALLTVLTTLSKPQSRGWLWFSVQDAESGIQYMFTHFFAKTYTEDIVLNQEIKPINLINVYKEGVPHFTPQETTIAASDTKITMIETIPANGLNMPSKYKIRLPGGKNVILALACKVPNIYPVPHAPYECPAYLYDESGTKIIGTGLIEANWYFTFEQVASRILMMTGGNPQDVASINTILTGLRIPSSVWQKIMAFFVVLAPLWLLVAMIGFVMYKKENRRVRLLLSIAIFLMFYWIFSK